MTEKLNTNVKLSKEELKDRLTETTCNLFKSLDFNKELMEEISKQQLEIVELKMDMQFWFDELEKCEDPGDLSNFCLNLREYLINKLSIKHFKKILTKN